ncbi:AN1-type zinc finger protein 6 [Drosophila ficusphila]|uniref:AN1-type zinc finger protein 6 n=1 Tax=Drosophila ficusphila TaxID=30025 RepID=UPI0007E82DE1|nr:AN1-type zinc finger protein 6 [Drosophila ficusphila]
MRSRKPRDLDEPTATILASDAFVLEEDGQQQQQQQEEESQQQKSQQQQQQDQAAQEQNSKAAQNPETSAGAGGNPVQDPSQEQNQDQDAPKKRCDKCGKKLGLTGGFPCRCGGTFCTVHRYSDRHECNFDYRELGASEIRRDNPVVVAEKLRKL